MTHSHNDLIENYQNHYRKSHQMDITSYIISLIQIQRTRIESVVLIE